MKFTKSRSESELSLAQYDLKSKALRVDSRSA